MANGRPLKFRSVEALQTAVDKYFASCFEEIWHKNVDTNVWEPVLDRKGNITMRQIRPFTITGLALALNTTRETLLDYEDKPAYSDTIKKAKEIIHNYTEEQLMTRDKPTGVIFNLKNNYGWRDRTETELTGKDGGAIEINTNDPKAIEDRINELIAKRTT
jgi:hypothetical protein